MIGIRIRQERIHTESWKPVCTYNLNTRKLGVNTFAGTKLAYIQLELAKEEDISLRSGVPAIHEMSPAMFIQKGLELKEQQCVLFSLIVGTLC